MRVMAAFLFLGGCMVPVPIPGFSQPYRTQAAAEKKAARDHLAPRELLVPDGDPPKSAPMRVRAWVDTDFRGSPRWRAHVEQWVGRASAYTEAAFGAPLSLDIRTWDRSGDEALATMLDRLEREDPGEGVDMVVGFVRPASAATNDYHRLGVANILGKHIVLRDMNDADEARALDQVFPNMDEKDRLALYAERKHHKELLGFLHEWAHALGHPHDSERGRVMASSYSHEASTFTPQGAELLRLSVRARRGEQTFDRMRQIVVDNVAGWSADERSLLMAALGGALPATETAALATSAAGDWRTEAVEQLNAGALTRAERRLPGVDDGAVTEVREAIVRRRREMGLPSDSTRSGVRLEDEPAVREAFVQAMQELGSGEVAKARRLHAEASKRFPQALPMQVLACCIEGWAGQASKARKQCAAALQRWDEIPFAHFWLGQVETRPEKQIAHHRRVIELDPDVEGSWQALGYLYKKQGNRPALNEIRSGYQTRFHRQLPQ